MAERILLVEGTDEVHVVRHLLQKHNYSDKPLQIEPLDGFEAGKWRETEN